VRILLKNNIWVVALYLVLVLISSFFLANHGKVQIHLYMNQLVGNPILDKFFYFITYLGDGRLAFFLLLAIMLYNVRLGLCAGISFLVATLGTNLLKFYFFDEVYRPYYVFQWFVKEKLRLIEVDDLYIHNSFPSGHATQAFAIFFCLSLFAAKNLNKFLFLSLALLTAFSRVYLSQHWLVDITVGSLIGTSMAILMFYYVIHTNKMDRFNKPLFKIMKP
jgi:membrane-associated phospholipid phosphatase